MMNLTCPFVDEKLNKKVNKFLLLFLFKSQQILSLPSSRFSFYLNKKNNT